MTLNKILGAFIPYLSVILHDNGFYLFWLEGQENIHAV